MPGPTGTPISAVPATSVPNADLPAAAMPSLTRIAVTELVGPPVANRQVASLEKRDETIRTIVNLLVTAMNSIDDNYLRRDGTSQQSGGAGVTGDIPMQGHRLTGMATSAANGQAVEHSQLVAEQVARAAADAGLQSQINLKANIASPTFTGTPAAPTPAASDNSTRVATTAFVQALVSSSTRLPAFNLEGDGLGGGGLANVNNSGTFFFDDLVVAAAQTLNYPTILYVEGNFDLQVTGSITSGASLDIICSGNVNIAGNITVPHLRIRAGGTVTASGIITTETAGVYHKAYDKEIPYRLGGPAGDSTSVSLALLNQWRAVLIEAIGSINISGAVSSDDIFITTLANFTASSVFRARWFLAPSYNLQVAGMAHPSWRDTVKSYISYSGSVSAKGQGGSGGTAGGGGGSGAGTPGGTSVWSAANRPYLFPTYELARGGFGGMPNYSRPGAHARGGGRISIYAGGNATLTGATFNVDGDDGDDLSGGDNGGGAGGGSCRIGCAGTMTGGAISAKGGEGDSGGAGGGGLAASVASAYGTPPSKVATAGTTGGAANGTTASITLTTPQIEGLHSLGLFDAFVKSA